METASQTGSRPRGEADFGTRFTIELEHHLQRARAAQKIRRRERGWRYAVEQLVAAGAPPPAGELSAWLKTAMATLATVRHPGNHRYAWAFSRRERRGLSTRHAPYPRAGFGSGV